MVSLLREELSRGSLHRNMSEADLAYAILKAKGEPIYFRDLFEEVLAIKPVTGKDKVYVMAGIHTDLNLDARFVHAGKGEWALKEWMPAKEVLLARLEEDPEN